MVSGILTLEAQLRTGPGQKDREPIASSRGGVSAHLTGRTSWTCTLAPFGLSILCALDWCHRSTCKGIFRFVFAISAVPDGEVAEALPLGQTRGWYR